MEPRKSFCATSVQVNNPEGIQAQASLDEFFKEWKQDLHASAETVDAEIEGKFVKILTVSYRLLLNWNG